MAAAYHIERCHIAQNATNVLLAELSDLLEQMIAVLEELAASQS
jgi:hypothetical protein